MQLGSSKLVTLPVHLDWSSVVLNHSPGSVQARWETWLVEGAACVGSCASTLDVTRTVRSMRGLVAASMEVVVLQASLGECKLAPSGEVNACAEACSRESFFAH